MNMNRQSRSVSKSRTSNIPQCTSNLVRSDSARNSQMPLSVVNGVKRKRPSGDRLSRISMASGSRVTPNKYTTPIHNNYLSAVQNPSYSRQSNGTVRSSIGLNSGKEIWKNDSEWKTHCIDNIMEFLIKNNYECHVTRKSVQAGQDFRNIFTFIYKHIDTTFDEPSSQHKFPKDVPLLLKTFKYPISMTKSNFATVAPHQVINVLSVLNWLINLIETVNCNSAEDIAYENDDFIDPDDLTSALYKDKFMSLVATSHDNSDELKQECLQSYSKKMNNILKLKKGVFEDLYIEEQKVIKEINKLPNIEQQIRNSQKDYQQLMEDRQKLDEYNEKFNIHLSEKLKEKNPDTLAQKLIEKKHEYEELKTELAQFEELKNHQHSQLSPFEVKALKNKVGVLDMEIAVQEKEVSKLNDELGSCQIELSKKQMNSISTVSEFNQFCRQLDIDCPNLESSNVEENVKFWQTVFLPYLLQSKKELKEEVFQRQKKIDNKLSDKEKIEELIRELEVSIKCLECKKKRLEEEMKSAKEEANAKLNDFQTKYDASNEEISNLLKSNSESIYSKRKQLEELKEKHRLLILKDQQEREKGTKVVQETFEKLRDLEKFKKESVNNYVSQMNEANIEFLKTCLDTMKAE